MTNTLTIFSTPTCGFCHMLKSYLKQKGVEYTEKDITMDREAYDVVANTTGQLAVPVLMYDKEFVIGFDRPKVDALLESHKLLKSA